MRARRGVALIAAVVGLAGLAVPAAAQPAPTGGAIVAWTYTVQPGDTFLSIARRMGVSMADLAAENAIPLPYLIRVGQVLRRPDPGHRPTVLVPAGEPTATPRAVPRAVPASRPALPPRPAPTARPAPPPPRAREADGPAIRWPTSGAVVSRFAAPVAGLPNNGIDLAAFEGMIVRAAAAGTVLFAGTEPERFGQLILIDHGRGWVTAYAYLGRVTVKEGQVVKAGQPIAAIGRSGEARRPTLHFELRRNNIPRDPGLYLPVRL